MKPVFMIFMLFLILSFLAGIYFCMYSSNMYVPFEGMDNDSAERSNRGNPNIANNGGRPDSGENRDKDDKGCPNLLVQSGNSILLYNTNRPNDETNPLPFYNLDEYANYLEIQKHKGIHCPVLFLQQESNAQGDDVYRMRPDIFNPQPGLLQNMPTPPNQPPKVVPVIDASRESRLYNKNNYAGFDPYGLQVGQYSVLDKLHDSTEAGPLSDNPMDPNWGGVVYTQQKVDTGKYADNEVMVPAYTKSANTYSYPQLYNSDGSGRRPPNYTFPNKTQSRDRWSEDMGRSGAYDVNKLATTNSGVAYNDRIDTPADNNKNTVANTGYSANIPGMRYEISKPVSYQDNVDNWDKYNGGSGNVNIGSVRTGLSGGGNVNSGLHGRSSGLTGSNIKTSDPDKDKDTSSKTTKKNTPKTAYTSTQIDASFVAVLTTQQKDLYTALKSALILPAETPAISSDNQTQILTAVNSLNITPLTKLMDALQAALQNVIDNYTSLKTYKTVTKDNIGELIKFILVPALTGIQSKLPTITATQFDEAVLNIKMSMTKVGEIEKIVFQKVLDQAQIPVPPASS